MKRSGPLRRNKPLAKMSKKRRSEYAQRMNLRRDVFEKADYRCEAAAIVPQVVCFGGLDAHEITPRATHPGAHLDPTVVIAICRGHHTWTHQNPADAYAYGLLVRRVDNG